MKANTTFILIFLLLLISLECSAHFGFNDYPKVGNRYSDNSKLQINMFSSASGLMGYRVKKDDFNSDYSIQQARFQFGSYGYFKKISFNLKADFIFDRDYPSHFGLNPTEGWLDLREANINLHLGKFVSFSIGRKSYTWGNSGFLFVNDLFAKNWQAKIFGMDNNYFKIPIDMASLSLSVWNINALFIFSPKHTPDLFSANHSISFYNPLTMDLRGLGDFIDIYHGKQYFKRNEYFLNISRYFGSTRLSLTGYKGYNNLPNVLSFSFPVISLDYSKLFAGGISVETQLYSFLFSIEGAYYKIPDTESLLDINLTDDLVKGMIVLEREIVSDNFVGFKLYLEHLLNYSEFSNSIPSIYETPVENNYYTMVKIYNNPISYKLIYNTSFTYCFSDQDYYLNAEFIYKITDSMHTKIGINYFDGKEIYTYLSQLQNNSNVYIGFLKHF